MVPLLRWEQWPSEFEVQKNDSFRLIIEILKRPNKTNDLILNLTPENVTQHSRIVTTTRKGSSTPTKMSKINGHDLSLSLHDCQFTVIISSSILFQMNKERNFLYFMFSE